jgi:shikimate dehydrogenase
MADTEVAISAATRLLALLGDPVLHSLSPVLHNAALRAKKLDAVYLALRCSTQDLPALLNSIARAGGAGNVTIPHKQIAAATVERATDAVRRTGACNTYWLERGQVCGDNTDVEGFLSAIGAAFGDVAGARVLLLGAGGGARAVLAGLGQLHVDSVQVVARTQSRAEALAPVAADSMVRFQAGPNDPARAFDLVVNATPQGIHDGDPLPVSIEQLSPDARVFDLVYRPGVTAWVRAAHAAGLKAVDGKEMLLQQAAAAFARWWGVEAPLEIMRDALADAHPS